MNSEEDKFQEWHCYDLWKEEEQDMLVGLGNKGLNLKKIFTKVPLTARIMEKD